MKLKYIFLVIVLILSSFQMMANDDFIEKISDLDGVTTVYISKPMLGLMKGKKTAGVNIGSIASKLNSMTILTSENEQNSEIMRTAVKSFLKNKKGKVNAGYEQLMKIKNEESKVDMFMKKVGDETSFVMIIDGEDDFTIILIQGQISLEDIKKLTSQ